MKERVRNHKDICKELTDLYESKNTKYGNSFETTFEEYGPTALLVRLDDKTNRAKTLLNNDTMDPGDESVRDTLLDLANYAIMGIMELDKIASANLKEIPQKEKESSTIEKELNRHTKPELVKLGEALNIALPKRGSKSVIISRIIKGCTEEAIQKELKLLNQPSEKSNEENLKTKDGVEEVDIKKPTKKK